MRSQRVLNLLTLLAMHFSQGYVLFTYSTFSLATHTNVTMCAADGCGQQSAMQRVVLRVKGGCKMSRHLGQAYCSLNSHFK